MAGPAFEIPPTDEQPMTTARPRCRLCRLGIIIPQTRKGHSLLFDRRVELTISTCDSCSTSPASITAAQR